MYKSIDLFAGIGGIRLGFEQAFQDAVTTVFVSEWDRQAQRTYTANFGEDPPVRGDITRIEAAEIPAHDILLAGFPCQAFSIAGRRRGFEDTRGTLFFDVARIAAHHRPAVIFCENVKNLLRHDRGRTLATILRVLEELDYKVFYKILNSRDYGVPQNRERIYLLAFRRNLAPARFAFPAARPERKLLGDILEEEEVSAKYYLSTGYLASLRRHKARHARRGNGFGYEIRESDDTAAALVCGGMGRERNLIVDRRLSDFTPVTRIKGGVNREYIRRLTPRECARLQGFPEHFKLPVADTHLYKQFGNSVTVPVVRAVAEEVRKVLEAGQ